MKSAETYFLICLAAAIGAGTTFLYSNAGFGAAGALLLGALFSTAVFSICGGRQRIWLAFIAVLPPFIVSSIDNLRGANRGSMWEAFWDTLPTIALAFGTLVALPLLIVSAVFFCTYRRRSLPTA